MTRIDWRLSNPEGPPSDHSVVNKPSPRRLAVALAAGVMLGGTSLATAGALPGPVQGAVHDTLVKVGVGDARGTERYKGPECDASKGDYKNHGQYVKLHKGDPAVAKSRCGKPIQADQGEKTPAPTEDAKPEKGPCQGPPPWAGKGAGKDKAAKTAAQAERRARCGGDEEKNPTTTLPPTTVPAPTTSTPSTTTIETTTTQP